MRKVKIEVDNITPGMKLAEPIMNAGGVTLMPAGIRLTPMFILRLKKWDVHEVKVFVEDKQPEPAEAAGDAPTPAPAANSPAEARRTATRLTAAQEELARRLATEVSRRFVNVRENPLMMQLRTIVIKRLVGVSPGSLLSRLRGPAGDGKETEA